MINHTGLPARVPWETSRASLPQRTAELRLDVDGAVRTARPRDGRQGKSSNRGASVSTSTVSREMGHGSQEMVDQVYSHLGQVRHRSEVVEYRIDQHSEQLADRLAALQRKTGFGTTVSEFEALR